MAKMMKVNGNLKVTSSVIAEGNLVIKGSTKSVDAENLLIKDNLVVVARDNTTALVTPAGLLAKNYDGENDGALVFDADGVAYVGDVTLYEDGTINSEVSDLQPLATRELEPLDTGFAKWDATTNKFITDTDVASLTKLNKAAHSLVLSGTSLLLKDANESDAALSTITQTELRTAIATGVNANENSFIFPKYNSTGLITGATAIAKLKTATLNGTSLGSLYSTSDTGLTLYAPSSSGNNNQVLISKGANNAPVWVNQSDLAAGKATNDKDGNAIDTTYLKKSGGTMEGPLVITGGDAASGVGNIQLSPDGQIVYQNSSTTLFGMSGSQLIVGTPVYDSIFRGKQSNLIYNGKSLPFKEDLNLYTSMVPAGTSISSGADLNTVNYLKVGNHFCSTDAAAETLKNSPTYKAFMMQVYSPLGGTDNETTAAWMYRVRKIMTYTGIEYIQQVYTTGTAGVYTFGEWKKISTSADLDSYKRKYSWTCTLTGAAGWYRICTLTNGVTELSMSHHYTGQDSTIRFGQTHFKFRVINKSGYNGDQENLSILSAGYTNNANKITQARFVAKGNELQYFEIYKNEDLTYIFEVESDHPIGTAYTTAPSGDTVPNDYNITSSLYVSYTGRIVGTVSNAVKDSDDNVITDTYLKKTGDTISGDLSVTGQIKFPNDVPTNNSPTWIYVCNEGNAANGFAAVSLAQLKACMNITTGSTITVENGVLKIS